MKKIIQEEGKFCPFQRNFCWVCFFGYTSFYLGRDARNLLFWTVPPTKEVAIKHDVAVYGRSKSETRLGTVGQQLIGEASRGRTPRQALKINDQVKKPESKDIRARYWSYLFENLRRAIDKVGFYPWYIVYVSDMLIAAIQSKSIWNLFLDIFNMRDGPIDWWVPGNSYDDWR